MRHISQLTDGMRQEEQLAKLREISQKDLQRRQEKKSSDARDREFLKDDLAQQILAVITTVWPSEDKRLADDETFQLAKNLFKNEFKGLTADQIQYGINRITSLQWPPTPFEFRKLCLPTASDLGLDELNEAFAKLQRRVTDKGYHLDRPLAWIYQHIDTHLLMDGQRQKAAMRHVEYFYDMCKNRLIRKESLDLAQPKAIEQMANHEPVNEQDVLDAMAKLGLKGAMKTYSEKLRKKS